jgi:predicted dehydrogenase
MANAKLRIAIVGCGKIADSHAAQIVRIRDCEIVGVCDREELMARQLYERFPIGGHYSDLQEMLERARPEVVHITTPPQGHFDLARRCLEAGAHVYVEKPFTVHAAEAQTLLELAEQRKLKVTVGHDDQFSHVARRLRKLVESGYLGGSPVHLESYYCYDLSDPAYARALLGDKQHWVRRLPGKLLHNIISHGIARIAEFLHDAPVQVTTVGFVSPPLQRLGEEEIIDELRVILRQENGPTAYFTFSSQMRPSVHQFRIFGPRNGVFLDQDQETLILLRGGRFKSYVERFYPQVLYARQYLGAMAGNVRKFLVRDFHMKSGMKFLIESFYRSIREGAPLPITPREILTTARVMEEIFQQLNERPARPGGLALPAPEGHGTARRAGVA